MRTTLCALLAVAAGTALPTAARAQDRTTDLLGWVPSKSNLVLFVDADAIGKSALAKKEKWGTSGEPLSGLDTLPPNVAHLIVASHLDPRAGTTGEVFVAKLKKPLTDAELQKVTTGVPDKLAGKNVYLTANNRFVTNLAKGIAGGYQPANRQDAGRWLREVNGKLSSSLSPVLALGGSGVTPQTPVVLVLDTSDMFSPALVKTKLAKSVTFKDKKDKIGPVADLIGQLQYLAFSIGITDKMTGELRLEFGEKADALEGVAQPLMLEVLTRLGMHDPVMDKWTATVKGNTVTFSGALTTESANDILAPMLRPSMGSVDSPGAEIPMEQLKVQASQKYFQAVYKKMSDVKKSNPPTWEKLIATFNSAARYIEELPLLNVDDELLDWGAATATTFRTMAIVSQKANGMITLAEANRAMAYVSTPDYYTGGGYVGGYYGGTGWSYAVPAGSTTISTPNNYGAIDNLQTITGQSEALYRRDTWKKIDAATLDLRRKMVKKYNVEF